MATINVLMDGDKSVCAFFKKKKYTLTIIASNGTVSGAGTYRLLWNSLVNSKN